MNHQKLSLPHVVLILCLLQTEAALMITSLDEVGELPFKSPPPLCQQNLTREGLVRKLRGIQKRAGSLEDYYERFNEVLSLYHYCMR